MSSLFFYLFSTILVLASLAVVRARNPLYNVLSLVVVIFSLASLFILLEAYFVGVILVLVYAGAVLVFFLFVVMCLNLNPKALTSVEQNRFRFFGWLTGAVFLFEMYLVVASLVQTQAVGPSTVRGTIETVGQILFTEYLLPFELTSLLLLVAVFGIVALAQGAFGKNGNDPSAAETPAEAS
jgi:NADH-quinone oxidoreductase subunit J